MKRLSEVDREIYDLILKEEDRQTNSIRLIPSENYVSQAVIEASASILTNKYSEGYPQKRYYQGQEYIDQIETIAVNRAKLLFSGEHANVQPYSGSPANLAVYFAFLNPGDTIMGLSLPHGGHLTHGWKVSITGKYFRSVQYTLDEKSGYIDYDLVRDIAMREKPKIIMTGATAYPRIIEFDKFGEIAKEVGAILVADISHIAGLVAGGSHPHPFPHADIITTTTHKSLRGPRGAMIICKEEYAKQIDRAVFPGLQGGPHNHTTAAIAVALKEAMTDDFKEYARNVVENAKTLASELISYGYSLVSGGTDNHLILIDLSNKNITGKEAAIALEKAGIVVNYNTVPGDKRKPFDPSGIRLGTPAITTRGMGKDEMIKIAKWIDMAIHSYTDDNKLNTIKQEVKELCSSFPIPGKSLVS